MSGYTLKTIARIRSDFQTKFGIPRQSGLVEELEAKIRQKLFSMKQSGTPAAEPEEPEMRQAPAAYGASRGVSIGAEDFIDED